MIPHNPALILQGGVVYPVAADSEGRIDGPGKEQTRVFTDDVWDYDRFGDDPEDGLSIVPDRVECDSGFGTEGVHFGCASILLRRGQYEIGVGCG